MVCKRASLAFVSEPKVVITVVLLLQLIQTNIIVSGLRPGWNYTVTVSHVTVCTDNTL